MTSLDVIKQIDAKLVEINDLCKENYSKEVKGFSSIVDYVLSINEETRKISQQVNNLLHNFGISPEELE